MRKPLIRYLLAVLFLTGPLTGCRTYYQRQQNFHRHFQQGDLTEAARVLERDRQADNRRVRLLYLMNKGVVQHLLGNYAESNHYFEQAYILGEDFRRNFGDEALALLVNPRVTEYRGEPFELLMVHYYKAMNFIQLGDLDAALVECRRLNIALNALSDRYRSENKYRRDGFIHNLMGIIYDAAGDYNNAFIAYRNALEIYEGDYLRLFGIAPPEQLKKDLLRAAYRTGFMDQLDYYGKKFDMTYEHRSQETKGEVVFFWKNGLGPVKEELNIMFTMVRGSGGQMHFVNQEMGMSFPVPSGGESTGGLGDLRVVRVAFPRFTERRPVYASARLDTGEEKIALELAQNINALAFQSLEDRFLQEMGQAILRLALRQATEQRIRKEDESLGALFGLLGAAAEQADTRNWQTLPHSIYYVRSQLPQGRQGLQLDLILHDGRTARSVDLETYVVPGKTTFINFHTLNTYPPGL